MLAMDQLLLDKAMQAHTHTHTHTQSLIKPIQYKTFLNKMLIKSRIQWIVHKFIPFNR